MIIDEVGDLKKFIQFRIKLWSYDVDALIQACEKIKDMGASETGTIVGPYPLPKKTRRWCLLKSPHVNKKSREHFEATTYSRIMDIHIEPHQIDQYGEKLCKAELPPGVRLELRNTSSYKVLRPTTQADHD